MPASGISTSRTKLPVKSDSALSLSDTSRQESSGLSFSVNTISSKQTEVVEFGDGLF